MSNENVSQNAISLLDALRIAKSMPAVSAGIGSPPRRGASQDRNRRTFADCVAPQVPPVPAKPTQAQFAALIEPLLDGRYMRPIGAIPKDVLDPRAPSKAQKSLAHFTANQMFFSNFGKDGEVIQQMKSLPLASGFSQETVQEFVDALYESMNYIGSSGSLQGLLTRMARGYCEVPRLTWEVGRGVKHASRVLSYHPVDVVFSGSGLVEVFEQVGDVVNINFLSNAGVPYYAKIGDGGTFATAIDVANMMLQAIAAGQFDSRIVKGRPALLVVLLKNKQDYYRLDKLGEKIRPYFVYGLHERLLYSCIQAKLKAVRFDEEPDNPRASSAVGFSWNSGGGDRLYDWINRRHTGKRYGFHCIFYGDDQLWVMVMPFATCVLTPDFSHMDMSLVPDVGKVAYKMWQPAYKSLDNTWTSVLKLNCQRAFKVPVVIDGANTYFFEHGLKSGVPGTTKFDEVASAVVCGDIQEVFDSALTDGHIGSLEDVEHFLKDSVLDMVRKKYGLVFKDGTLQLYTFESDQNSYEWEFLGQSLVRLPSTRQSHYVPKPNLTKLLISATTMKKQSKSARLRVESTMYKVRSLFAGGGYHYKVFADRAEAYWESLIKRKFAPINETDEDFANEVEGNAFYVIPFENDDHSWPTWQWCANQFLPPDDQRVISSESYDDNVSSGGDVSLLHPRREDLYFSYNLGDFSSEDEEEEGLSVNDATVTVPVATTHILDDDRVRSVLKPRDWASQMELEREPGVDKGIPMPQAPPEVGRSDTGRLLPLSEAQKKAFEDVQNERRAREREARALKKAAFEQSRAGKVFKDKTGRGARGRSGADIYEEDFDYQHQDDDDDEDSDYGYRV